MNKLVFAAVLAPLLTTVTVAQDQKPLPPKTIREVIVLSGRETTGAVTAPDWDSKSPPADLFFCPPKTCLYYSGDFDTNNSNNNALFDINNPGINADGGVWVGVKPTKDAIVTGTSGNFATDTTRFGINPTPFAIRTRITPGQGGKLVCRTAGNAILEAYEGCDIGVNCFNYYIRKLKRSCTLAKGKVYFVFMQLQYDDGSTVGYLWDDDGTRMNRQGWPEIIDDSYFSSSSFHVNYEPTWGSNGGCGGIGCDGFSISLTGRQR
jgi:hypothetical protein